MNSKALIVTLVIGLAIGAFFMLNNSEIAVESNIDHTKLIPGVAHVFLDEIIDGPAINKQWDFPEGIVFRVISEDSADRIKKLRFVISSPGKETDTNVIQAQSGSEKIFYWRSSGSVSGSFDIFIMNWVGYNENDNTATGVKLKCSFNFKKTP